jgi:hypothetical protein
VNIDAALTTGWFAVAIVVLPLLARRRFPSPHL